LKADLGRRSVRGGAITFVGQGAKFFLQLGSTMVLARLLTPQDFGLIAMVAAVSGFILVFKDMGLSMATVQKAEINHGQISTLFWINVAISLALTLITIALAPVIVWFFKEPRLMWVTVALASAFIFGGLTIQHQALLRRQMRFLALVTVDICAMAIGITTAIVCAWAGMGYWSLVLMQLTMPLSMAVGVWIASGWLPGMPVRRSGVRSMLGFGGYLTGFGVVNYFARNLDKILLGRFWGAQSVGLYTKAYSLLLLPIGQITAPITAVAVPALSRLQKEPERFRNYYLRAITLVAYATIPLVVAMGVLSAEIIQLVLGEQWVDAAPIFMILAIAAVLQPVSSTVGWIYVSLGQAKRMFQWACSVTPLIVVSFLVGLRWGPIGIATGYAICITLITPLSFMFALKRSPITVGNVFSVLSPPFALSIIMGLAMTIARVYLIEFGPIWTIVFSVVVGGIVFLLLARAFSSVAADLTDIGETARSAFR